MTLELPSEIIDLIIDHLHDDKRSLRACSQICRQWRPACQYHLFSRIEITPQNIALLLKILKFQTPPPPPSSVAQAVHHVGIGVNNTGVQELVRGSLPIIFRFPNLRSLSLKWIVSLEPHVEDLSALSNLQHVELDRVHFPDLNRFLRLIYSITQLRSLSIPHAIYFTNRYSIHPETMARYSHPPGQPFFSFRDLALSRINGSDMTKWILSLSPMPPVNELHLDGLAVDENNQRLLHLVGPSLQKLELTSEDDIGEVIPHSGHSLLNVGIQRLI